MPKNISIELPVVLIYFLRLKEILSQGKSMKDVKYEVYVTDDQVTVIGNIPLLHAIKLVHYFEDIGYTDLLMGDGNSTLSLSKSKNMEMEGE